MALKKRISLLNLSLPAVPDVQKDENFLEFSRIYSALKALASVLDSMQTPIVATAGASIPFGSFVNFYNVDGTLYARLADATISQPAHAYCLTENLSSGDSAEFLAQGIHPGFSGLTPGQRYFLGTGGLLSASPPELPMIQQAIGFAISDSTLWVQCPIDYLGE